MFADADLPARQDLVITDVTAVTMDPQLGELAHATLTVESGVIVAVTDERSEVAAHSDGRVIDGSHLIAVPGFVDTHWHLWNSLLRGTVSDAPGRDYFSVKRGLGPYHDLDDFYWAARFALAEAVAAGITTVHNWDHNVRSAEDADANVRAQLDAGVRGRFSYGPRDSTAASQAMDLEDLRCFVERWPVERVDGLLDFGVALRGPYRTPRSTNESGAPPGNWDSRSPCIVIVASARTAAGPAVLPTSPRRDC